MTQIEKIAEMFRLQNTLNVQTVGVDWHTNPSCVFENAIIAESTELLDSLGYKWWKHQVPDMSNAKLEVVDLWHFTMSLIIKEFAEFGNGETFDDFARMCEFGLTGSAYPDTKGLLETDIREFVHQATVYHEDVYSKEDIAVKFGNVMRGVGMDLDQLYSIYIVKNALNKLRQDYGYASGQYQKMWNGREDNDVAIELCDGLTYDAAYSKLQEYYTMQVQK